MQYGGRKEKEGKKRRRRNNVKIIKIQSHESIDTTDEECLQTCLKLAIKLYKPFSLCFYFSFYFYFSFFFVLFFFLIIIFNQIKLTIAKKCGEKKNPKFLVPVQVPINFEFIKSLHLVSFYLIFLYYCFFLFDFASNCKIFFKILNIFYSEELNRYLFCVSKIQ